AAEAVEFLRGLDEEERKLFRVSHESAKAAKAWLDDEKRQSRVYLGAALELPIESRWRRQSAEAQRELGPSNNPDEAAAQPQ
ncbi:hypothetical protein V490_09104, partial [Pseudogymnoascus sp. VKM F-3557]